MTGPVIIEGVLDKRRQAPIDYETLAEFLRALAYPVRLELLDALRFPHSLGEIKLSPRRGTPGASPDRPAARQTVQGHLDKLVEADLIRTEDREQEGRRVPAYSVNPLKLYELTEELRRISVLQAGHGLPGDATGSLAAGPRPEAATGPRLVLVHGVYEGKSFRLDPALAPDRRWTIGRKRGLHVTLDYDPYVSLVNSVVSERRGDYYVEDAAGSKNGTSVNWALLPKSGGRELRAGDVIGVGRSLLSFVPE